MVVFANDRNGGAEQATERMFVPGFVKGGMITVLGFWTEKNDCLRFVDL